MSTHKIAKNCATCGWSFVINATPKMPQFEPDYCEHCALASDAKWRADNTEKRAEMQREMMAKFKPQTP